MRSNACRLVVLSAVLLGACVSNETVAPEDEVTVPSLSLTGGGSGECRTFSPSLPPDVSPVWPCAAEIQVVTTGSGNVGALQGATALWNASFPAALRMPRFVDTPETRRISIEGAGPTISPVTGQWKGTRGGIVSISLASASGSGSGVPRAITLHELVNIMALGETWDGAGRYTPGVSRHCISTATGPGGTYIDTGLCRHLVELFLFLYGARTTQPDWDKHIVTSLGVPASITLTVGTNGSVSVPLLSFAGAHPDFCGPSDDCDKPTPASTITWRSTASQIVSVTPSGNGAILVPQQAGSATVYAVMSSPIYELSSQLRDISVTVIGPPNPPSNVAANSVTHNSATVTWTSGDPQASTVVEYQRSGQTTWTSVTAAVGATSRPLTSLTPSSTYSVRVYHQKSGLNSSVVLKPNLFQTAAPPPPLPPITAFSVTDCAGTTSGGKQYNNFTVTWTSNTPPSSLASYEIRESSTNSTSTGSVIRSGRATVFSETVGPYLASSTPRPRYFWVRYTLGTGATAWFALTGNPLNTAGACN
jgi:hypothetical protein